MTDNSVQSIYPTSNNQFTTISNQQSTMSNNNEDLEGADIWGDSSMGSGNTNDNNNDKDSNNNNDNKSTSNDQEQNEDSDESTQPQPPQPEPETPIDAMDDDETQTMSISELRQRIHLLDNDIRVMKSDCTRISHESRAQKERIRENQEKVKVNKQLPYLVGNVVEVLEPEAEDGE